jgi:glycosyltransferase involved in cell wall biosynthesis
MKILAVQETDWIKRGPHQQHHLLERISTKGHTVHVIDFEYLWNYEKNPKRIRRTQVLKPKNQVISDAEITLIRPTIIKLPIIDKLSILFLHKKAIQKELDSFQPDVVIAFGILNASIARKECKKRNIPFVYYLIDHLHTLLPNKSMQLVAKRVEQKTLAGADKILVINKGLKDYCIEMGAKEENIDVIPAGVDLERYDPTIQAPDLKEKYGIKDDDTILFFMGWIYDFSGMKEVAEELSKNDDEHLKLMIVGDGDLYQFLQEFRDKNKLENRLLLTGKVPFEEIPRYLSLADICLLPAYKNEIMENIVPIKMYEYMAMGKPVISTMLPGIQKEFGMDSGVLYEKNSERCLTKAIDLIHQNTAKQNGEQARLFVSRYDWEKIINHIEKNIFAVLKE